MFLQLYKDHSSLTVCKLLLCCSKSQILPDEKNKHDAKDEVSHMLLCEFVGQMKAAITEKTKEYTLLELC